MTPTDRPTLVTHHHYDSHTVTHVQLLQLTTLRNCLLYYSNKLEWRSLQARPVRPPINWLLTIHSVNLQTCPFIRGKQVSK